MRIRQKAGREQGQHGQALAVRPRSLLSPCQPSCHPNTHDLTLCRYSLAADIAAKERVAAEATRLAVGKGKEFAPAIAPRMHKNEVRCLGAVS